MRRPPPSFFPPIPVTFTRRKGKVVQDQDLLRAWHGTSTEGIRQMVEQAEGRELSAEDAQVQETRRRVLALREQPTHMQLVSSTGDLVGDRLPFAVPGEWPEWTGPAVTITHVRLWQRDGTTFDMELTPAPVPLSLDITFRLLRMSRPSKETI